MISTTSTKMLETKCFKIIKILVQFSEKKTIKFIKPDKMARNNSWLEKLRKEKIKIIEWLMKIQKLGKCNMIERERWLNNRCKISNINKAIEIKWIHQWKPKMISIKKTCCHIFMRRKSINLGILERRMNILLDL